MSSSRSQGAKGYAMELSDNEFIEKFVGQAVEVFPLEFCIISSLEVWF
jgi:hypothetical protein